MIMAELLGNPEHIDSVPVFLQLATWNPDQYPLGDWIVRQISEIAPELQYKSNYGLTAIVGLIYHKKVLLILDGLDTLPQDLRRSVLASDTLLRQSQLVLTCRTDEFGEAAGGFPLMDSIVYTPGPVRRGIQKSSCGTRPPSQIRGILFSRKYQTIRKVALPGRCLAQGSSTWQALHIRITIPKSFLRAHPIQAKKMWRVVFSARSPWPRCPLMAHGRSRVLGIVTRPSSGYVTWQAQ